MNDLIINNNGEIGCCYDKITASREMIVRRCADRHPGVNRRKIMKKLGIKVTIHASGDAWTVRWSFRDASGLVWRVSSGLDDADPLAVSQEAVVNAVQTRCWFDEKEVIWRFYDECQSEGVLDSLLEDLCAIDLVDVCVTRKGAVA